MPDDTDTPLDAIEFDDPVDELFFAIRWCDRPGVAGDFVAKIRAAHAGGADLDAPNDDGETPLVEAILGGMGAPSAVRVLLELGADPSRAAPSGSTPWAACLERIGDPVVSDRMEEIRALLEAAGADRTAPRPAPPAADSGQKPAAATPPADLPPKYAPLYAHGTNGINFDLETHDVVARLREWDERFGIELSEIGHDRVVVSFRSLPDDVEALAREIYAFCPDVVDQGYGCFDDMLEMSEAAGEELPPEILALVDGIDFDDDDFGIEILERDLAARRAVALWWD